MAMNINQNNQSTDRCLQFFKTTLKTTKEVLPEITSLSLSLNIAAIVRSQQTDSSGLVGLLCVYSTLATIGSMALTYVHHNEIFSRNNNSSLIVKSMFNAYEHGTRLHYVLFRSNNNENIVDNNVNENNGNNQDNNYQLMSP